MGGKSSSDAARKEDGRPAGSVQKIVLLFPDLLFSCAHFGVRRLVAAFFFRGEKRT
jgi:hypothetical protein